MKNKKFKNRNIGKTDNIGTYKDIATNILSGKNIVKLSIILLSIFAVLLIGIKALGSLKGISVLLASKTVDTISSQLGDAMIQDEYGNVNVVLLGYGGALHEGGLLADSIMVASWNPKLGSVSFISVPRDLYIYNKDLKIKGKINSLFASAYYRTKNLGDVTDEKKNT